MRLWEKVKVVFRRVKFSENCFFLGAVVLVMACGMYGLIKTPQKKSQSENRTLTQFEHFTIRSFLNGKFQDNFENALSDQFIFSEKIRAMYGQTMDSLPKYGIDKLACANRYLVLKTSAGWADRAIFNCEDYIVVVPDRQVNEVALGNIEKYNSMNKISDVYYYYIKSSNGYDFATNQETVNYAEILSEKLEGSYHLASLNMNGWEKYKEYFYKTDHHWNYVGSYRGFLDIVEMFGIKDPSVPTGTVTSEEYFFGSGSRVTQNYGVLERFTIYTFDIPEHDTLINGESKKYNHISEFIDHKYNYNKNMSFYGEVYGKDYGEIVFNYNQPDKPNLLIISNSFSDAINELVAQYFNKTYVVDLRYYEKHTGSDFEYSKYIKEHHIDKTLVIADLAFLSSENLNQGLEK